MSKGDRPQNRYGQVSPMRTFMKYLFFSAGFLYFFSDSDYEKKSKPSFAEWALSRTTPSGARITGFSTQMSL